MVVVGAGAMGLSWLRAVMSSDTCDLAGIVDLDPRRALGASIRVRAREVEVGADLAGVLVATEADFVINANRS